MNQAPELLPKFKKPPVVEVALGVQFGQLAAMHVGHIGMLWERFKKSFPRVEQQAKLPHVIERRGVQTQQFFPSFSVMTAADHIGRIWLLSEDGADLIQVQTDRFHRNWRRYHNISLSYPSYDEHNRPGFVEDLDIFNFFVLEQNLGRLVADQCEVSYINHIYPCSIWSDFSQLDRVFNGWSANYPSLAGTPLNTIGCRVRHEVLDDAGAFVGHLFVDIDSAYPLQLSASETPTPVIQLQLTLRGRPLGGGKEGVMQFMDFAHAVIVKSFTEVTTSEMHQVWGRYQ